MDGTPKPGEWEIEDYSGIHNQEDLPEWYFKMWGPQDMSPLELLHAKWSHDWEVFLKDIQSYLLWQELLIMEQYSWKVFDLKRMLAFEIRPVGHLENLIHREQNSPPQPILPWIGRPKLEGTSDGQESEMEIDQEVEEQINQEQQRQYDDVHNLDWDPMFYD